MNTVEKPSHCLWPATLEKAFDRVWWKLLIHGFRIILPFRNPNRRYKIFTKEFWENVEKNKKMVPTLVTSEPRRKYIANYITLLVTGLIGDRGKWSDATIIPPSPLRYGREDGPRMLGVVTPVRAAGGTNCMSPSKIEARCLPRTNKRSAELGKYGAYQAPFGG